MCSLSASVLQAQAPPYTPLVWDENWAYLSDRSKIGDWSDHLKHIGLFPDAYLSAGAQIRERGEYIDHSAWGAQPPDNGYFLQRYLLYTDWRLADPLRVFIQFGSSLENSRDGGPRPGIDQSTLYFNQAFVDYSPSQSFSIRVGRQLVSLGSTRLFAIGAGLNVQQPFDGVRIVVSATGWDLNLIALRPSQVLDGYFQSKPNPEVETWGLYASHNLPVLPKANLDLYYIGFDRKSWHYAQGIGHEQRETFGVRIWRQSPIWSWDLEFTPQTGRFGSANVRAWAGGYHLSRQSLNVHGKPRLELDGGVTSGDRNLHDHTLGTFNPLFPNGSYLSQSLLIGPFNLYIVRPKLELALTPKLSFKPNLDFLWRQSLADGIYNIAGILTHPGTLTRQRFVGSQIQAELDYDFSRHLTGALTYEHFFNGGFLDRTPPNHPVNFVSPEFTYTF